jgi:hypothetical protein
LAFKQWRDETPLLRDTEHDGTPLGWARYNDQIAVAEFLAQFEPQPLE